MKRESKKPSIRTGDKKCNKSFFRIVPTRNMFLLVILLSICRITPGYANVPSPPASPKESREKIQMAILLDTSGSMEGLIEQAKTRLWNIVNTLTSVKYKDKTPHIEIALYEYGSYYRYKGDYIRQVVCFTSDLDRISEELFSLTTGGSEEYCGTVIKRATEELEWSDGKNDIRLIYIAGNEIFEQGPVPYKRAIRQALQKGIYVNTIHCGNRATGIRDRWKDAADTGEGKFFNIDHNKSLKEWKTPFDAQIILCHEQLNNTYVSYGKEGNARKENQIRQDKNALSISSVNYTERAVSKSKTIYNNASWDLIDKVKEEGITVDQLSKEDLPEELKGKSKEELKRFIAQKESEREKLKKEIGELAGQRNAYIREQIKTDHEEDDLGIAITESVLELAKTKGYSIQE